MKQDSKRFAIINVVGLTSRCLGPSTPHIQAHLAKSNLITIDPLMPALTSSAQATYLTGTPPAQHGIVANGWYHRELAEHHFWKQSNHLVAGEKLWETLRKTQPDFTCAKLFWWNNMYSSADYSITPRPIYRADGNKLFDIYAEPLAIRDEIKKDLGEFPFPFFWGPMAGIKSSQWIAQSAQWIEERKRPNLSLVYLPHLDYNLQRLGPEDPAIEQDLAEIDSVVGKLLAFYEARNVSVIILSEYGITPVNRDIALNRLFRQQGWLQIKDEKGHEQLDCGASDAFAIADHQVAHVYVQKPELLPKIRQFLENTPGIEHVLGADEKKQWGLDHARSGDLVVFSDELSWFSYYYWNDDQRAPDFARTIDIHRKVGYDPAELFFDPNLKAPKLHVIKHLLKKRLGMRSLLNVIPIDASIVKGSHGARPKSEKDWPLMISPSQNTKEAKTVIKATEVHAHLLEWITFK